MPFHSPMHENEVAQLCPTCSDPMHCSLPGSSIHRIFQARVLEWGAIAFSGVPVYAKLIWAPLVAQTVKNLRVMQETQVRSLGREDPLEKGKATHFSNVAWEILWTEEPGGLRSMDHKESDTTERLPL